MTKPTIEHGRASITALRDAARYDPGMNFKVRDRHVALLHDLLDELEQLRFRMEGLEGNRKEACAKAC